MQQSTFNSIQNNFKKFLQNKSNPVNEPKLEKVRTINSTYENIERTRAFGSEDCEIGYRVSYLDKNGNQRTKIVATLPAI